MKKIFISLIIILSLFISTSVYAYRWVKSDNNWYVLNEATGEYLKGILLDAGEGVYYLDEEGRAVSGWWKNPKTEKFYFFDNKQDRNFGAMIFGLHVVDGYSYYFGDDGSLQASDKEGEYKNVFGDYYADYKGYLYNNNQLVRDTSIAKSEFYTNPLYYDNPNLNNYYLANFDKVSSPFDAAVEKKSDVNVDNAGTGGKKSAGSNSSGGTNYSVDELGIIHDNTPLPETSAFEKFGPMKKG